MLAAILLTWLVAPAVITYALRKTRVYWLPALGMAGLGVVCFTAIDTVKRGSFDEGMGNLLAMVAGVACVVYSAALVFCVVMGRAARTPPQRHVPELPRAVATRVGEP